jgi:hypothetical protein
MRGGTVTRTGYALQRHVSAIQRDSAAIVKRCTELKEFARELATTSADIRDEAARLVERMKDVLETSRTSRRSRAMTFPTPRRRDWTSSEREFRTLASRLYRTDAALP